MIFLDPTWRPVGFHMGQHVDPRGFTASTLGPVIGATRGPPWDVQPHHVAVTTGVCPYALGYDTCTNVLMCCET